MPMIIIGIPNTPGPNAPWQFDDGAPLIGLDSSGMFVVTLDDSTLVSGGAELFTGTLATTLTGATLAETAVELLTGTLAATLGDVSLATTALESFVGTLSSTLEPVTFTADGIALNPIAGNVILLFDDVTLSAGGTSRNAQRRRTQLSKFRWMKRR